MNTAATVLLAGPGRRAAYQRKKRCLGKLLDDQIELLHKIQFDGESLGEKLETQWEEI